MPSWCSRCKVTSSLAPPARPSAVADASISSHTHLGVQPGAHPWQIALLASDGARHAPFFRDVLLTFLPRLLGVHAAALGQHGASNDQLGLTWALLACGVPSVLRRSATRSLPRRKWFSCRVCSTQPGSTSRARCGRCTRGGGAGLTPLGRWRHLRFVPPASRPRERRGTSGERP